MKELIIDANNENVSIALLENKKLVEYAKDGLQQSYDVGNIYLGKVKKIMSGLNAAFVDIGGNKEAFIHYHDLGENFPTINNFVQKFKNNKLLLIGDFNTVNFKNNKALDNLLENPIHKIHKIWSHEGCNTPGDYVLANFDINQDGIDYFPTKAITDHEFGVVITTD